MNNTTLLNPNETNAFCCILMLLVVVCVVVYTCQQTKKQSLSLSQNVQNSHKGRHYKDARQLSKEL